MKLILKLEKIFLFTLLLYLYSSVLHFSLLLFFIFFFIPDISIVGYIFNTKIGAITYNIFHSYILPVILLIVGLLMTNSFSQMIAIIWIEHILFDRILGYGLKYFDSFKHTHLS